MNRQLILFVTLTLVMLTGLSVKAQTPTQSGYIKTPGRLGSNSQVTPGTRISGATISLVGHNAVVSSQQGTFSFPVTGNKFTISNVAKSGYTLVERDALKQYSYSANPLILLMASTEESEAYKLAAEKRFSRTLKNQLRAKEDEIERLREENRITQEDYHRQLQKLYEDQSNSMKIVAEMAERFAKTDFDQLDSFNIQINNCLLNGELLRADSLLRTKGDLQQRTAEYYKMNAAIEQRQAEIAHEQADLESSKALRAKTLADLAEDYYTRASICSMQSKNDSVAYYLSTRADLDSTNIEWQCCAAAMLNEYIADYQTALHYYNRGLRHAIAQSGEVSPMVALIYNGIGKVFRGLGEYYQALDYYRKDLEISLKLYNEEHPDVATTYNDIAMIYYDLCDYRKAMEYQQKSLNIRLTTLGESNEMVASNYDNIGLIYNMLGDYDKALEYHQKSLEIHLNLPEEEQDETSIATNYNNIGLDYNMMGEYDKALEYHLKDLDIRLKIYGENHPGTALSYNNIGGVYYNQHNYDKALEFYNKSLNIKLKILGERHPDNVLSYYNIGIIYDNNGDYDTALEYYQKCLDIINLNVFGEHHKYVSNVYKNIGKIYLVREAYDKALEYFRKSLEINHAIFDEHNPSVYMLYGYICNSYVALGELDKALPYALKFDEIIRSQHWDARSTEYGIYQLYTQLLAANADTFQSGFDQFMSDKLMQITVQDDSPATGRGLNGQYYMVEYCGWNILSNESLFNRIDAMQGKPKTITIIQDGEVRRYSFEDRIGITIGLTMVTPEEHQHAVDIYKRSIQQ